MNPPPPQQLPTQPKQQPFKMTFTKFVPISKKNQTVVSKKNQETDLKSMFGVQEDEKEEKKQDTSIKVNRKTNIHYAVHNNGEK